MVFPSTEIIRPYSLAKTSPTFELQYSTLELGLLEFGTHVRQKYQRDIT